MEHQPLSIQLLGTFHVLAGAAPLHTLHAPRIQALLALLVLKRDTPQPRQHLAFCLWPNSSEAQAQTNLRNLVYQLRRLLPQADDYLVLNGRTVQWRSNTSFSVDVASFEQALGEADRAARCGEDAAAQASLEAAITCYRGDLLPTCYDDWILLERERLHQRFTGALEQLTALLEAQRNYAAAARYAQRLVQAEPLQESTYLWLIRLQMLNGDGAAALHTYQVCAATLQRDLATEPGERLRAAYAQLIALDHPPPPPQLDHGRALVGRRDEWSRLLACWRAATTGMPQMVLLSGEAGIGKTRLAEELLHWAERQGLCVARAQCYAAEGDLVYAPLVAWLSVPTFQQALAGLSPLWLAEIARVAPELVDGRADLPQPGPITEPWQRRRLFEALARAILGAEQPLMLLLDDLQWCDRATIEWLHYLLRYDSHARLLLLGVVRTEDVATTHGLDELCIALREQGQVSEITLGALSEADTAALAAQVAGQPLSLAQAAALYRETEGNPFFVVESIRAEHEGWQSRALGATGAAPVGAPPWLPPRIAATITARLARLSPLAREIADLAAASGRAFSSTLLACAGRLDEATLVCGLDELWQRRIIRERGERAYDFSHDKLRQVAYHQLSAARRRLLHRRIAEALEGLHAGRLDTVSAQLAFHYEQAGCPEPAARAYLRTAEANRRIYANEEAISAYRRALALCEPPAASSSVADLGIAARTGLGEVLAATERHPEAREVYTSALALIDAEGALSRARLHRLMANTWRAQAQFAQAERAYELAAGALEQLPPGDQAAHWHEWIELQLDRVEARMWQGSADPVSAADPERMQTALARHGTGAQHVRLLWLRLILTFWRDHCGVGDAALADSDDQLAASEALGDVQLIATAHWAAGQSRLLRHEFDQADKHLRTALTLAEQTGDMQLQARCLVGLSLLARGRRQPDLVRDYASRSGALATAYVLNDILGAVDADHAWLAWRAAALDDAALYGRRALEHWRQSPIVFPFHWAALLPLAAAALAYDKLAEAVAYAQALLVPTQQRLPPALETALSQAAQALAQHQPEASRIELQCALVLAEEHGFL